MHLGGTVHGNKDNEGKQSFGDSFLNEYSFNVTESDFVLKCHPVKCVSEAEVESFFYKFTICTPVQQKLYRKQANKVMKMSLLCCVAVIL